MTFKEAKNRFQGTNSARLCCLAGRYDNPIPTQFLAHMDSLKIPAQFGASCLWHANLLIICLYLAEKDIRWRKDNSKIKYQTNLDRQCPILNSTKWPTEDPPLFSLHTSFKSRILYRVPQWIH